MKTFELMHNPVTLTEIDSIEIAARCMRDEGIGCLVVAAGARPIGIITDRDIVTRCIVEGHDTRHCRVENHLTRELITTTPEADALEALDLMVTHKVKRLPVVEHGHLVGVISFSDVAAALEQPLHQLLAGVGAARRAEPAKKLVVP
jgi:CBS domain-containing protein